MGVFACLFDLISGTALYFPSVALGESNILNKFFLILFA